MFEKFCLAFDVKFQGLNTEINERHLSILNYSKGAVRFMKEFQGQSFQEGLYRVHKTSDLDKWNSIIFDSFPTYSNKIFCFSYKTFQIYINGRLFGMSKIV